MASWWTASKSTWSKRNSVMWSTADWIVSWTWDKWRAFCWLDLFSWSSCCWTDSSRSRRRAIDERKPSMPSLYFLSQSKSSRHREVWFAVQSIVECLSRVSQHPAVVRVYPSDDSWSRSRCREHLDRHWLVYYSVWELFQWRPTCIGRKWGLEVDCGGGLLFYPTDNPTVLERVVCSKHRPSFGAANSLVIHVALPVHQFPSDPNCKWHLSSQI